MSELRRNLQINGETYHLAVNQYGSGAPGTATPGKPGVLYMDTNNGDLYKCRMADPGTGYYIWQTIGSGSSNSCVSWNELTDKPFVPETLYYEWDENICYWDLVDAPEDSVFTYLARLSTDTPAPDFFQGKSLMITGLFDGQVVRHDVQLNSGNIIIYSEDMYIVHNLIFVVTGESCTYEGVTMTRGVWILDGWKDVSDVPIRVKIHDQALTLDDSVIPYGVARISDVDVMISYALGVIENGAY